MTFTKTFTKEIRGRGRPSGPSAGIAKPSRPNASSQRLHLPHDPPLCREQSCQYSPQSFAFDRQLKGDVPLLFAEPLPSCPCQLSFPADLTRGGLGSPGWVETALHLSRNLLYYNAKDHILHEMAGLGTEHSSGAVKSKCPLTTLPSNEANAVEDPNMLGDQEAADRAKAHYQKRLTDEKQRAAERELDLILHSTPIYDRQITEIIRSADILFFDETLKGKVEWRWSEICDSGAVATTALRRIEPGQYRTQITLSRPVLESEEYDQRLLMAAVLHEVIHSYLIISCGQKARDQGGHTKGFRQIACMIDRWVGNEQYLHLYDVNARLENFRASPRKHAAARRPRPCARPRPVRPVNRRHETFARWSNHPRTTCFHQHHRW